MMYVTILKKNDDKRKMMTREKLEAKLEKLEERLLQEKIRQHKQIENIGWGAGMRRVHVSPSFKKEDSIKRQIENVKEQLKRLPL